MNLLILLICITANLFAQNYHFFQNKDVKLAFREKGNGPTLIILNGGPGRSSDSFIPLSDKISDLGFRTVLFDQRGTGRSKLPLLTEDNVQLNLMVEDLEKLREHLKLEKISLLGHSFGGAYAMAYAKKYPERVKSLILSATPGMDLKWMEYVQENMFSRITPHSRKKYEYYSKRKEPFLALKFLVPAYVYHPEFIPEIERALLNKSYYTPKINDLVWKSMKDFDLKGSFKNFRAPVLILHGRQDILGEEVPLLNKNEFPDSKLIFFNHCGHYPWLDSPEEYFSEMKKFLSSLETT